ncbi:hypothetical protein GIB67_003022 [Kingdonia uniflora]|uniref:FAD synthase n=1 Tax=Kingdonia uniflora TaxID=39325 RepID=A0A7J7LYG5_9MAGN|nr:hypothetical protein GIB67_003022 [Kingdonia uniflora]
MFLEEGLPRSIVVAVSRRNHRAKPRSSANASGGIVALGKFDALHLGHRELAFQASKAGAPFLLSFVGMAEVLGWEPRAPVVAKCDRKRVLSSWTPYCGDLTPGELHVEFSSVRQLSPRQFVEKLSTELGVRGVVTGENYRFGYKAAGDTKQLIELCEEYGMGAYIVSSVMDKNQLIENRGPTNTKENGQVSSTRVRHALAEGDMKYVSELLGRKHRLMLSRQGEIKSEGNKLSAPKSSLLNLSPKEGLYGNCSVLVDNTVLLHSCKVMIDATHIYVESDNDAASIHDLFIQDWEQIGIEFGDT